MRIGPAYTQSTAALAVAGRWLLIIGVFLMVTGDAPASTIRIDRWPTPLPQLAWPWLTPLLLALGAAGLVLGGAVRSVAPRALRALALPTALLLGAFLLSTLFSQVPALSVEAMLGVLLITACGWALATLLEDDRLAAALWPSLAAAVIFLAFRVIVWRRDEGLDVVAFQIPNNAWLGKLQLAWVLNLLGPPLLGRFMGTRRWWLAALYALAWGGAGLATYVLFSRIGTVVFAATTIAMALLNRAYWRRAVVLMALAAAFAGGTLLRGQHTFRVSLSGLASPDLNPGIAMRLDAWREAVRLFVAHPITGTGIGTYDEVAYELDGATADPAFRGNGWHAHNVYLHVLAETGILGLAAWCYFWLAALRTLMRRWWHASPLQRLHIGGPLCAVGAFLVLSTTEVLIGARVYASLRMSMTIVLVLVLGLHAAASRGDGRESWIRDGSLH